MEPMESPELNPYIYGQLVFNKYVKVIQCREICLYNRWYWNNKASICKINEQIRQKIKNVSETII